MWVVIPVTDFHRCDGILKAVSTAEAPEQDDMEGTAQGVRHTSSPGERNRDSHWGFTMTSRVRERKARWKEERRKDRTDEEREHRSEKTGGRGSERRDKEGEPRSERMRGPRRREEKRRRRRTGKESTKEPGRCTA
ncbi:hypothetical protein NDU88_006846 [Pleurodeles waltl]|uniref:Uncharacterized protein n=1 Tax=Pleurodeles waltl TaxID=8319 RepID=A0AAV7WYR1_PLEWA|nr:hypothetical protein NDU88_006846 [Pleurodeles waltl]